jgi:stage V sporulation protein AA
VGQVVYIQLAESVLAERRKVIVKDVSQVVCSNPDIKYEIENIELMNFSTSSKEQQVISSLFIIEAINKSCSDVEVINLGVPDVIVYYKAYDTSDRIKQSCKFIILCLIAFLGAGFSIISYNSDVNLVGQLDLLQNLFVGSSESGSTVAGIAYSVGLFVGIIIFFNHGLNKKFSDDPTPLQVQMRKYEQEVNQAIIVDANRKQEARDAD